MRSCHFCWEINCNSAGYGREPILVRGDCFTEAEVKTGKSCMLSGQLQGFLLRGLAVAFSWGGRPAKAASPRLSNKSVRSVLGKKVHTGVCQCGTGDIATG
jgi:hypothetical protein